jgi:hypothetical protein
MLPLVRSNILLMASLWSDSTLILSRQILTAHHGQ